MRRLIVCKQVLVSLILSSFLLISLHYPARLSLNDATTGILSHAKDPPLHSSPISSPSVPSLPSFAPVTNTSNHTHCKYEFTSCGIMRCLLDLQWPLSTFLLHQTSDTIPNAFDLVSPNDVHHVILNASPICMIALEYTAETIQGERLTLSCCINSTLEHSTTLNLSLYHPLVGTVFETDLIMVKGENIFFLDLDVVPHCPPANYNLSFLLTAPEITLSSNQIPLLVNPVFTMLLMELPDRVVQNQLFETSISVTNHGSQPRLITIYAEAHFRGNVQVIVQPNQTRLVPIIVEYCPQNVMDTGVRQILFTISLATHHLVTAGASIFIGYSLTNMLITIAPFGFLIALCILGICWLRVGKRSSTTPVQLKAGYPPFQYDAESQLRGNNQTTPSENQRIQPPPSAKQISDQLTQVYQQLGLRSKIDHQVANNRVTLTWEDDGAEVQITLPANNLPLINQVLNFFVCKVNQVKTEGELIDQ